MGEVYRAHATRAWARDVAIKVLPQHLSANSEVRARFEREAKAVSSLNHPISARCTTSAARLDTTIS
jgi:serine/threonine protein kinase